MFEKFMRQVRRIQEGEEGITALETAIILIAFVVVASVFAFTVLSAGTFATERGKEAVYAGLTEVQSTMELKGNVLALGSGSGTSETVESLVFTLANAIGGEPIDLTEPEDNVVNIEYHDKIQRMTVDNWTVDWKVGDGDPMLEAGELAEIIVPIDALTDALGPNTEFVIEVKPPTGAVLNIQRTTPASIEIVYDLR